MLASVILPSCISWTSLKVKVPSFSFLPKDFKNWTVSVPGPNLNLLFPSVDLFMAFIMPNGKYWSKPLLFLASKSNLPDATSSKNSVNISSVLLPARVLILK